MYELKREVWIPRTLPEVFAFFSKATNLETLTPEWLKFRVVTPEPIAMRAGALIEYRLKVRGLPIGWRTEILEWNPPYSFVDLQLKGPYKLWHHTHTFVEKDGGTLMTDVVKYDLPFGPLGRIVHWLQVKRDVQSIFDYRSRRILELFS